MYIPEPEETQTQRSTTDHSSSDILSKTSSDDQFLIDGRDYVKASVLGGTKRGKSTSWIWDYGIEIVDIKDQKRFWKCTLCKKPVVYNRSSTDHPMKHLNRIHKIDKNGPLKPTRLIETAFHHASTLIAKTDQDAFRTALLDWIVDMHMPFSVVENTKFQRLMHTSSSSTSRFLPRDGDTIRSWILKEFKIKQEKLITALETSKSQIHFSFDLWTSPHCRSILGVVGHYLNSQGQNVTVLLGLRRLMGSHSGSSMAEPVIQVIQDYKVIDKIGYFVLDNASNNDTCLEEVFDQIHPDLSVSDRCLRCFGHIVNLAAEAFLYGKNPEAFISEVVSESVQTDDIKELEVWRKRGPIGKLHNIVTFIRRTSQRREAFQKIIVHDTGLTEHYNQLQLVADNATRWNSMYSMIDRALKLRDRLEYYFYQNKDGITHGRRRKRIQDDTDLMLLKHDILSQDDWTVLQDMHQILEVFHKVTMRTQGKGGNGERRVLWECLPGIYLLMESVKEKK